MSCKAKQHFSESLMIEVTQEVVETKMPHISLTVTQFFVTVFLSSSSSFTCFPAYCKLVMWCNESVLTVLYPTVCLCSQNYCLLIILQVSHSFSCFFVYYYALTVFQKTFVSCACQRPTVLSGTHVHLLRDYAMQTYHSITSVLRYTCFLTPMLRMT